MTSEQRMVPRAKSAAASTSSASSRLKALRSSATVERLVQAALLKTLLHAIETGSLEGVRVAIERGVALDFVDRKHRNLLMLAIKQDTAARLAIVVILCDAGCNINHVDHAGWNCLHYACACGSREIVQELLRREAHVEFNVYGFGPEDLTLPKVLQAQSLLQHTEQLSHEINVRCCWDLFRKQAEKAGFRLENEQHCDLGKACKVSFVAPASHSAFDRVRVVDVHSDVPLWQQVSKTFPIPPGDVGTITLDAETLERPSLYRIFYEKYEPTPVELPPELAEKALSIKNLDTGKTESVSSINDLVIRELESTMSARSDSVVPTTTVRSVTTRCASARFASLKEDQNGDENADNNGDAEAEDDVHESQGDGETECEGVSTVNDTAATASAPDAELMPIRITGVYKIVAMSSVSVSILEGSNANEYEVTIQQRGRIGLHLEPLNDSTRQGQVLIVRQSGGQAAMVSPGDCLVAIGNENVENAGVKHTVWMLNEAHRPVVLRFRRRNFTPKKRLLSILGWSSNKRNTCIVV